MDMIKSTLHNLSKAEHPDPIYCRGLIVGVTTALMRDGRSYIDALAMVYERLPADYIRDGFPPSWLTDLDTFV